MTPSPAPSECRPLPRPGRWTATHALSALALLATACHNPPPARVDAAFGEVRAATPEQASAYAARAATLHDGLLEILPDTTTREACVWVFDDDEFYERFGEIGLAGRATWDRLGWNTRIEVAASTFDTFVAHEWVHVMLGPSWDPLPGAIEEGLATEAAFRVAESSARDELRLGYLRAALFKDQLEETLSFIGPKGKRETMWLMRMGGREPETPRTLDEVLAQPGPRAAGHLAGAKGLQVYGVGTLLVEAIVARSGGSFARLHRACLDHEGEGLLTTETLLALGGFESAEAFDAWLDEQFAAEAARRFFSTPESMVTWIDHVEGRFERTFDAQSFLDLQPAYVLEERDPVPLSERPDLRQLVIDNWPERGEDPNTGDTP